ncbi:MULTISPECIES: hypothetical protein [Desulfobacula]|uniref:Uncharacterized protein n=2 Tax=Desulfobacula TaxID=28222 RepID=K0NIW1_DESTT|nr:MULTISPECIES: hypothetical protein [Desulfobacula]CCK81371.1 uncharacterized protein TOL2_C32130 [Desulfobacula toluolica Tol2]SDU27579.1 hypothetical protein SAMN04487931_10678 [Desulfobacula phenolica]
MNLLILLFLAVTIIGLIVAKQIWLRIVFLLVFLLGFGVVLPEINYMISHDKFLNNKTVFQHFIKNIRSDLQNKKYEIISKDLKRIELVFENPQIKSSDQLDASFMVIKKINHEKNKFHEMQKKRAAKNEKIIIPKG